MSGQSPRDVALDLLAALGDQDWDTVSRLYAEDVVVHWPLCLPEPATLEGREAIHHMLRETWGVLEFRPTNIRVHETGNPDIVIAEYDYDGRVVATGRSFQAANVLVLTVHGGQIVNARGYHNHAVMAAMRGIFETVTLELSLVDKENRRPVPQ
ncbi:nuclear transport factor 2 family protein [Streptomyces sp. NBC_01264]|uniref:nuclear transport factor 2 family protein n=1 Tax=Streptomyces sp. NBC_01264 TaxID=2903804 RepID=UPI002252DCBB|nr:nuclear transport factor 2 family protein [Streptomyces sp. NBC_01264]MCX4784562.1 nuclear transport factor 2 family protein [Streptomyces sp. NBC_01264]